MPPAKTGWKSPTATIHEALRADWHRQTQALHHNPYWLPIGLASTGIGDTRRQSRWKIYDLRHLFYILLSGLIKLTGPK